MKAVAQAQRRPRVEYRWLIVLGVIVISFFGSGASWYAMGMFFSPLVEYFHWGRGAYSIGISLYMVLQTLTAVPIGRMVDRWGPRRVMLFGALGSGLCLLLMSQIGQVAPGTEIWQLYLIYSLLSLAAGAVGTVPTNTVVARWFTQGRGLAMGLSIMGFGLPGVIMVPLSAPFIAAYGWRAWALLLGVLSLVGPLPFILGVMRDNPPQPAQRTARRSRLAVITARDALRMAPFWIIGMAYLLAQFSSVAVQMHAVPFLMDRGLSRETASEIWGFLALAGIVGKVGLGWAGDRFPARAVLVASLLLQASSLAVALIWPSVAAAWLFALLFGLGMGGQFSARPLLVGEYFGLQAFGTIIGLVWLFTLPGVAAGQPVAGFIYDVTGSYRTAVLIFIGAYLLATAVILSLRKSAGSQEAA